jgi:hypothetical protein
MRVSTEKLHICTEKRLSVTEQRQNSTEKFDFHGITTRLYGEGACFCGAGLALMGHSTSHMYSLRGNYNRKTVQTHAYSLNNCVSRDI